MSGDHPLGQPPELAALYVTGAMTPDERRRFDEHLAAGCGACAGAIRRLAFVAQALAPAEQTGEASAPASPSDTAIVPRPGPPVVVVRVDDTQWRDGPYDGVMVRVLHVDHERLQYTALVRMAPHTVCPEHVHSAVSQCLIIEGELQVGDQTLQSGDYVRTMPGVPHGGRAGQQGCLAWIIEPLP